MILPDYIITKIASAIGGLLGGGAILTYIRPKTVGEAFMRGGISVGSAMVFAGPALHWAGMDNNWENQVTSGFIVGFLAYSILGMIANFLQKNSDKDIVEAVKEIRK